MVGYDTYMNIFQAIVRIIYPDLCFSCRELGMPDEVFCRGCLATVKPIASRLLPLKNKQILAVHAVGAYENALHKLVIAKFRRSLPAAQAAGKLMTQLLPTDIFDVDYIVPVPLYWRRYANRGYNQSVEIAKVMSKVLGIPYYSLLMRAKNTKFQYLLSAQDRHSNLEKAFIIRPLLPNIHQGARILLIDDLCTTGATLQEAANVLQKLNPSKITAAVCARALS